MSIEQMREYLRQHYGYARAWVQRVNKMSDTQVVAIYYRLIRG